VPGPERAQALPPQDDVEKFVGIPSPKERLRRLSEEFVSISL